MCVCVCVCAHCVHLVGNVQGSPHGVLQVARIGNILHMDLRMCHHSPQYIRLWRVSDTSTDYYAVCMMYMCIPEHCH